MVSVEVFVLCVSFGRVILSLKLWLSLNSEGGLNMMCDAMQQIFMAL